MLLVTSYDVPGAANWLMKVVVFMGSSLLPRGRSGTVAPLGHCCVLASLKRGWGGVGGGGGQNCIRCSGDHSPVWLWQSTWHPTISFITIKTAW